ncbi:eCIS core domain-containing protein [Streptomyces tamarix]|uniref:eCIS core domain-containing protein n=1 Tax=Streptomyces tamarix TaxID=3078565 RepID=UPI0037043F96
MRAHEQRADQAGDRGRNRPKAPLTTPALQLLALQRAAGNAAVARAVAEERHEHDAHCGHGSAARDPAVQRSAVHEVLRSPGRPLDGPLRSEMEARFGGDDFSGVRVHTDAVAQRSATEIGAKAYTSGSHVVWDGQDKHTLAHELDHYRQQSQGSVPGTDNGSGLKVSDPSDWAERQAEETARRVMSGAPPVQRARATTEDRGGGGRAAEADGHAPVQRALDTEMIDSAREALGITGTVKIVEVPEDVRADTPFAAYPAGHCVGLTDQDGQLSIYALNGGDPAQSAAEAVRTAGGGGYFPQYGIIVANSNPSPGFTVAQTIQHELGHLQQHEAGFDVDMSGGRRALVEYHNVLVNENRLTGEMRSFYTTDDNTTPQSVREKAVAQGINLRDPWKALIDYLAQPGVDPEGSQKRLLDAIVEELKDEKYDAIEGRGMAKAPVREKIKGRIGRMYFNKLFA